MIRAALRVFRVDANAGYRWYTCGAGRERADAWGWVKLGPVSFTWGKLAPNWPARVEMHVCNRVCWVLFREVDRMRMLYVLVLLVATPACASRSYVVAQRSTVNAGISGVVVESIDGHCQVALTVRGDDTGRYVLEAPDRLCADAGMAAAVLATVPAPKPVLPAAKPVE
ncbi:MAG: hypothetical protein ACRD3C_22615 [Vicinamibacterales bacterium]